MAKYFFSMLPMILPLVGSFLKGRDSNATGADDAFGNIFIAAGPAMEDLQAGAETTRTRKAIAAIRDSCDAYLKTAS
jgi:hypothetical protein